MTLFINDGGPRTEKIVNHHLLITGQTGSGKTTTTLSLIDQLQKINRTTIILDPTGEYTVIPNAVVYHLGKDSYLDAGQLSIPELFDLFSIDKQLSNQLAAAVTSLRIENNIYGKKSVYKKIGKKIAEFNTDVQQLGNWASDYHVEQLANQIIEEMIVPLSNEDANYRLLGQAYDHHSINHWWSSILALQTKLANRLYQNLFDTYGHVGKYKYELNYLIKMFLNQQSDHKTLVIDLSLLKGQSQMQRVIVSVLARQMLDWRLKSQYRFPVRLVIDEAHRYLPVKEQGLADNGIFQIAREGRKVGLGLILTTQSPLDLPARLRSQFTNHIIHRLTSPEEMASFGSNDLSNVTELGNGEVYFTSDLTLPQKLNVALPQWWRK